MNPVQIIAILAILIICFVILLLGVAPEFMSLPIQIFMAFLLIALAKQFKIEM